MKQLTYWAYYITENLGCTYKKITSKKYMV